MWVLRQSPCDPEVTSRRPDVSAADDKTKRQHPVLGDVTRQWPGTSDFCKKSKSPLVWGAVDWLFQYLWLIFNITAVCMHACSVTSVVFDSLWPYRLLPTSLLCPWEFAGKPMCLGLDRPSCHNFWARSPQPEILCAAIKTQCSQK